MSILINCCVSLSNLRVKGHLGRSIDRSKPPRVRCGAEMSFYEATLAPLRDKLRMHILSSLNC